MKKTTLFVIFIFLLTILFSADVTVLENTEEYTIIEFTLSNYTQTDLTINNRDYTQFSIPSQGLRLEIGNPELPIYARSIIIPPQAKMKVQVLETSFKEIDGNILPSKGSLPRSINPDDIPYTFSEVYNTDSFFPQQIVEINDPYIMRELRGIAFRISPFSVNPVQEKIRIYDRIVFKIYSEGIDTIDVMNTRANRLTKDFVSLYKNHFINYNHTRLRYDSIEEQGSILIIAFPAFLDAMQPYVDWKNQKGIKTVMVSSMDVGLTPDHIKDFIISYWTSNTDLAYVQLVGDSAQIATEMRNCGAYGTGGTDPAYVMINGNNSYPDLFIGRFSAETVEHVEVQVQKTIYYERDIVDGDWLHYATGIASDEGYGWNNWSDITHMNNVRNFLIDYNYITVDQIYDPGATREQVAASLNEGRGIVNYIGHGLNTVWGTTGFNNNDVSNLKNDWNLPHIVSVACLNGNFTATTCFAEAWLRAVNPETGAPTGAVATYMSTISQPWNEPMPAQWHINQLLSTEQKNTIGGLYFNGASFLLDTYSNTDAIHTIRTWHIFGDASLMVRTGTPASMKVSSIDVFFLGETEYQVSVDTPGALVSLYHPDKRQILGAVYADENGNALIHLEEPLTENSILTLTITAFNKITYIKEVIAIDNLNPYLILDSYDFSDGTDAIYGTNANINVSINNVGSESANSISLKLSTDDAYITIIEDTANIEFINSQSIFKVFNAFNFDIDNNAPNNHVANFLIEAKNNDFNWNMKFSIPLKASILQIGDINVDSTDVIKPGDMVDIFVPFINIGSAASTMGNIYISSNNPDAQLLENNLIIEAVNAFETKNVKFTISVNPDTPPASKATFGIFAMFGNQTLQSNFTIPIAVLFEGFESGDFSAFNWTLDVNSPWVITDTEVFEGVYSISSANITNNQTSMISISQYIAANSTISFYYKVSSLQNSDVLQFYLNNSLFAQWSGEVDWTFAEFNIPAGNHQFRWVYRKGSVGASGLDKAWIDSITFPVSGGSDYNGPVFYTPTPTIVFDETFVGSEFSEQFYIVNLGNTLLTATVTIPEGFALYNGAVPVSSSFIINANQNNLFTLKFNPLVIKDYSNDLIFTTNINSGEEFSISLIADVTNNDSDLVAIASILFGNYPNPFNPDTKIKFYLDKPQHVNVTVYNIRGQQVKLLANKEFDTGSHDILWDGTDNNGRNMASGVYFYRFVSEDIKQVRRMTLMK